MRADSNWPAEDIREVVRTEMTNVFLGKKETSDTIVDSQSTKLAKTVLSMNLVPLDTSMKLPTSRPATHDVP